ncbi:(2Fe-2S)-binding protein [Enterovirga rhinocerotis]|uniref:Bacterioferritin-associated ferredoxin n=1 Tax=Enterovirga rhinocerotis TaxID=1339210 RepID=A0A4R7CAG1_9HYPH|nr:(2Fe-2S)-binding protein [Enterovirga rhinocerotis]TDR94355.1 bacterioferritin-associated ferredoxin [Enterovirga rhinocerotis]
MIVCSCNVLSDGDVKACLAPGPDCPRTPAQVYRCLGCSPNCGRCARSIRAIMDDALLAAAQQHDCTVCKATACPGHHDQQYDFAVA